MPKHRKLGRRRHLVSDGRRLVGYAAAITYTAAAATVTINVSEAQAAPGADWNSIASCESSGNWSIHTGLFEGGLQFLPSTWIANGGGQYAQHAYQATPAQQVAVAEKVLATQGPRAWPVCFRSGSSSPGNPIAAPLKRTIPTVVGVRHIVSSGETLASIAAAKGTTWQQIAALNRAAIPDPGMIFPGQSLRLS